MLVDAEHIQHDAQLSFSLMSHNHESGMYQILDQVWKWIESDSIRSDYCVNQKKNNLIFNVV